MRGGGAPSLMALLLRRRPASLPLLAAPPCAANPAAVLRAALVCGLSVGGSCVSAFSFFCFVSRLARPPFGVLVLLFRLPCPLGCGPWPRVFFPPRWGSFFLFWGRRGLACLLCGPRLFFGCFSLPPSAGAFVAAPVFVGAAGPLRSCPCSMPRRPCGLLAPAPLRLPCSPAPLGCYLSVSVVVAAILSVDNFLCFLPHCQHNYLVVCELCRIFVLNLKH